VGIQFEYTQGNGVTTSVPSQEFYGSDGLADYGFSDSIIEHFPYSYSGGVISFPEWSEEIRLTFDGANSGTFEYYDLDDLNNEQLEESGTFVVVTSSLEEKTDWQRTETFDSPLSNDYWQVWRRSVDSLAYDDGELSFIFANGTQDSDSDTELVYGRTLPMDEDWQVVLDDIYAAPGLSNFEIGVELEIASSEFECELSFQDYGYGRGFGVYLEQQLASGDWEDTSAYVTASEDARISSGGNVRIVHVASNRDLIFEYQPDGAIDWSELARLNLESGSFVGENGYGNLTGGLISATDHRMSLEIEAETGVVTQIADLEIGGIEISSYAPPIDSDGDGLSDSIETNTGTFVSATNTGSDPNNADTDGDGIDDGDEVDDGTNPNYNPNTDSDGDGVSDRLELSDGTDPNNSNVYNPLSAGLVAYYPFNGNANDQSLYVVENQYANDGNVYGASLGVDRNNVANSSYDFDGFDDFIDLGDPDILDLSASNYTYSLWFRTDATGNNYYMLSKYETLGANAFGIGTAGTDYLYSFFAGDNHSDAVSLDGTSNINDGAWHHVVMAIDLDNYEYNLYLDGVLEGTKSFPVTSSGIDSDSPLLIGKQVNGQNFDGSIDDVRIYNRALSGAEITALYESESMQFQIISGDFTWTEAKADAESRGGRLAVLNTQGKINAASSYLESIGTWPRLWLGASDVVQEGIWNWINDDIMSVHNWFSGEPNGGGSENYLQLIDSASFNKLLWNDANSGGSYLLEILPYNNTDSDGDGLDDSVETNTGVYVSPTDTGTDPNNADSSGDGFTDGEVVSAGLSPVVDYSSLLEIVRNNPERFGLENTNSTVDMKLRGLRLERADNGAFNMNFDLEMSTDLQTWSPHTSHSIELSVPDQSKTFMRLNVK
jgi:hypothetical protein